jgi:hypothetical protein
MKKIILVVLLLSAFVVNAQEIKVKEEKEKINGAINPVLTVIVYGAEESTVEKAWKNLMKDYNAKVSTKDGVFADNAMIKDLSENTVDIYAFTKKTDEGIRLVVGVDLGGIFISSSSKSAEYKVMEKIIKNFAIEATKNAIQEKADAAEKVQKKLEGSYDDLVKKNEDLHKDIEEYKNKITKAEKDIEDNLKEQETAKKAVETQKNTVEQIKKQLGDVK